MALVQHPVGMMPHQYDERTASVKEAISMSATQSVRTYSTNQEYLYAMREDLADWLKGLYTIAIDVENFFEILKTGVILCQHANNITSCAQYLLNSNNLISLQLKKIPKIPSTYLNFTQIKNAGTSSFFARDNIANFINWCRRELAIHESLMFETDDLVQRKNEKNFILCLLEVARRGSKFGVPAPVLIQMEEDIDEEIEMEKISRISEEKNVPLPPKKPAKQKVTCDFKSLDEMVQYILGMCTCPTQFPMVRVSDGKYKVGGSENLIFMRILRQHVMVRVGGGWDTLENYLNKHDPCRCQQHKNDRKLTPRHSRNVNSNSAATFAERASTTSATSAGYNKGRSRASSDRTPNGPPSATLSPTRKPEKRMGYFSKHESPLKGRERSYTPNPESRSSRSRVPSTSPEHRKSRKSTNQKENQSTFYNRLSRPKSTPPVTRNTSSDLQGETLVVQRSRKGAHEIHRASAQNYPDNRQSLVEKATPRSSETNRTPRSKSVSSSPGYCQRASATSKTPRPRKSASGDYESSRITRSASPKKQLIPTQPLYEEIDESREREMLLAFEKECIANQQTLEMRKHRSRKHSSDNLLETSSNAEDNEVAFHMNSSFDDEKDRLQNLNSYSSLPRPRKDKKSSQHERRTKIPTPVSFNNRSLLSSRHVDYNENERNGSSQKRHDSVESDKNSTSNDPEKSVLSPDPTSRGSFSLDELNQLLSPSGSSLTIENETNPPNVSHKNAKTLDASLLHSSAHPGVYDRPHGDSIGNRSAPSFPADRAPVLNPHSAPPSAYRYISNPSNDGFRRGDYANYNLDYRPTSGVPEHILKTCNLASSPRFEPEFLRSSPSQIDTYAKEPQWV